VTSDVRPRYVDQGEHLETGSSKNEITVSFTAYNRYTNIRETINVRSMNNEIDDYLKKLDANKTQNERT
jgi:hypothetical protein